MRKFFVRVPPTDPNSTKMSVIQRDGVNMSQVEQNLLWLLRTLWEDGFELFLVGVPHIMDEIERVMQSNPEADALISSHVVNIIGDLSIIAQCSRELELYQP
ncbi:hypothetical protein V2A60_010132 [Cordyceps javanica]